MALTPSTTTDKPALDKSEWVVREVDIKTARKLVVEHHYAQGASNTRVFIHGLFRKDDPETCWGVAWWLPPTVVAAKTVLPEDPHAVVNLSRLVLVPEAPRNAATFLLGKSTKLIRADGRYRALLTYADTAEGHTGGIYKASNWTYVGETAPSPIWKDSEGRRVSPKAGHRGPRGGNRTREEMVALGYAMVGKSVKHKYVLHLTPAPPGS